MAAAPLNLSAAKGEAVTFTCTHEVSGSDPTVVDISGWTITVTAKDDSGTTVLGKSATVTSGPLGTYTFSVSHADMLLEPAVYSVDIWRTDSGSETLMGYGKFRVTREVLY